MVPIYNINHYLRFTNNRPGYKWVKNFLRRHKDRVVIRRATNIRRSRAAVSPDEIRAYFHNLKRELEGVPASHIFNCDETNLRDDPGCVYACFKKGVKYPEQVKDHSKTCFSCMFCASANGLLLPPMTVYKSLSGNFYDTWATGGPVGSVFTANKGGWFNMRECETWFEKVFLKWIDGRIPKEEVKVLIMDNLSAHLSLNIMQQCRDHNIRLIFLPPNSTHLTQPLDVAVFAPMKKQWRIELNLYKDHCAANNIRNGTIPKEKFGGLLKAMLENNAVNNANNIRYRTVPILTFILLT
jgi:hypothetical protein